MKLRHGSCRKHGKLVILRRSCDVQELTTIQNSSEGRGKSCSTSSSPTDGRPPCFCKHEGISTAILLQIPRHSRSCCLLIRCLGTKIAKILPTGRQTERSPSCLYSMLVAIRAAARERHGAHDRSFALAWQPPSATTCDSRSRYIASVSSRHPLPHQLPRELTRSLEYIEDQCVTSSTTMANCRG